MSDELAVVEDFFAALRRGELAAVIELVADDVDWQSPVTRTHPPEIPWSSIRRSKDEVAAFLKQLGQTVKPEGFEVLHTTGQEDRVVVEGKNRGTVHATGRTYDHDWVMLFTVRDKRIVRFRHYYDTADLVDALRGD
jgi:ketosteroid isomerase-like protein